MDPTTTPAAEPTTTNPVATTPVAAPVAATAPAPLITMTPEEFMRLREAELKLQNIELQAKQQVEEKERERLIALSEQGEARKALTEFEARYKNETADLRDKLHRTLLANDIARSTLSVGWVSAEAASQANALLATEFEVVEANGTTSVRHKATGKPAAEVIPNLIASSAYAHFQKPTTTGGTGQAAADRTQATTTLTDKPRSLNEAMIQMMKEQQSKAPKQAGIPFFRTPSLSNNN